MFSDDSAEWMSRASEALHTKEAALALAGQLMWARARSVHHDLAAYNPAKHFDAAQAIYGIAYMMLIREGEISIDNIYARGLAQFSCNRFLGTLNVQVHQVHMS